METTCLIHKQCLPCKGSGPVLSAGEIETLLAQLGDAWTLNAAGHLYKCYPFSDFMGAMDFANKIAVLAEQEAHHPDLTITWGACSVEIWSHKINGLTESDFILAAKIELLS